MGEIFAVFDTVGFEDPFPASTTITLDNPAYRWFGISLMRGVLGGEACMAFAAATVASWGNCTLAGRSQEIQISKSYS